MSKKKSGPLKPHKKIPARPSAPVASPPTRARAAPRECDRDHRASARRRHKIEPKDHPPNAAELRLLAEAALRKKIAQSPESLEALSPEATRTLLQELRVHEIELEMQNEELRRAQVELNVSRARYFDLYDLAPVGYVTVSEAGVILQANFTIAILLGVTRGDLVARPLSRFMQKEDADKFYLLRKQIFATGEPGASELRLVKSDGTSFWAHLATTAAQDESGVTELRVVLSDITARRQAEAAMRESEVKFRTLFGAAGDAIFLTHGGRFIDCNSRALEMFGCQALNQIVGHSLNEFSPPVQPDGRDSQESAIEKIDAAMAGHPQFFEWLHTKIDGTPFPAEVSLNAVILGDKVLLQAMVRDITARQQAQQERELIERKMQETQKLESLGVLAGGIAHDFNNLLTGILGNAGLASMDLPPDSPLHPYLESINEGSLRAADLCKQMLTYSGRGRFVIQRLDLSQLVEATAQMLKISISKKAVLHFHLETGLPPVEADATQRRQVIMNLVINASEAIGDESGVIGLTTGGARVNRADFGGTVLAPELPDGEYVYLEVSDSGSGMSAETQARIFDPFFTTKFAGRGVGLAAVLGIVRGHQGAMKVESEPGRGTTFRLLFPAKTGSGTARAARPPAAERWQGRGTVLVVDDEEFIRSIAARMLRVTGFDSVLVADGREAVEVFRADPDRFTLVLLDLTMPHSGGEETFAELQMLRPDVRVVLMSGYDQQDVLGRFPSKSLAGFLQKPFTIDQLRTTLQSVPGQ